MEHYIFEMNRILVVVNPVAGKGLAKKTIPALLQEICKTNHVPSVFITSARGEAKALVMAQGHAFDRIICCGGDGTFNEVLAGLLEVGAHTTVGYIPTGTTNDLAHSLGFPTEISKVIELAVHGDSHPLDMGLFNQSQYYNYVASFGAFVKASYDTPQKLKNTFGHFAYLLYGITEVFDIKPRHLKVIADDRVIDGDFIFGAVSNSTHIAGMLTLPKKVVHLDDGSFELILVKRFSDMVSAFLSPLETYSDGENDFYFISAKKISFFFEEPIDWTVDGEYAGSFKEVHLENIKDAVSVVSNFDAFESST